MRLSFVYDWLGKVGRVCAVGQRRRMNQKDITSKTVASYRPSMQAHEVPSLTKVIIRHAPCNSVDISFPYGLWGWVLHDCLIL